MQIICLMATVLLAACQSVRPSPTPTSERVAPSTPTEATAEEVEAQPADTAGLTQFQDTCGCMGGGVASIPPAIPGLIQLPDPLDEPEYYCIDVPGFNRSLNVQADLMAHTCKPGADDEMFLMDAPAPGQISMPAYTLCMEARGTEAGAPVHLAECSATPLQKFQYTDDAQIRLDNGDAGGLCLTVASGPGTPTGGPSHLRRDLMLEACDQVEAARSRWTVGSSTVVEPAAEER